MNIPQYVHVGFTSCLCCILLILHCLHHQVPQVCGVSGIQGHIVVVHSLTNAVSTKHSTVHHQGEQYTVCVCVRACVCLYLHLRYSYVYLSLQKLMDNGALFNQQPFSPPTSSEGHTPSDEVDTNRLFHFEMVQVCIDLLARYTYSTVSSQPKRYHFCTFACSSIQYIHNTHNTRERNVLLVQVSVV